MRISKALALIALALALPARAADGPNLLNYQGVLRDSAGAPRQGTFDMRFRFFDAATLGNELLIDEHIAAGTGGVVVSGGLFNVALGGGNVLDGSGPGSFGNLREVVGAHDAVWLEIQVAGETLAPRVRLLSAAYALNATSSANASLLDSLDSTQFLRSDTDDTYTSGTLTTALGTILDLKGDTRVNGKLFMNYQGPDANQMISFYDGGTPNGETFGWSEVLDRFTLSNTLNVAGHLEQSGTDVYINSAGPDATQSLYFFDTGAPTGQTISWDDPAGRFYLSNDAYIEGTATVAGNSLKIGSAGPEQSQRINFYDAGDPTRQFLMWDDAQDRFVMSNDFSIAGELRLQREITFGGGGADGNQTLRFFEDGIESGETFAWDDAQDRFEITDELAIGGVLRTGTTGVAPVAYNALGNGTATSTDITNVNDAFVTGDLEVGDQLYMGGDNYLEWNAGEAAFYLNGGLFVGDTVGENLIIGGRRIYLDNGAITNPPPATNFIEHLSGQFNMGDDLNIIGTLTASNKNFAQNHPYDAGLEVIYTTLEGPEAATFTRGSGRLVNGKAHLPLDESFAWVTNPDIGLTATLTPRGRFANLYVEKVTTSELIVAATPDSAPDAAFDYLVMGLRIGYEEAPTVRPRQHEWRLPVVENLREPIAARPELAHSTPLARYRQAESETFGREDIDLSASAALRAAIGSDPHVASSIEMRGAVEEEAPASAANQAAVSAAAAGSSAKDGAAEAKPRSGSGTAHSYEDEQGNLYARSFRPNSGGLDSTSALIGDAQPGDVLAIDPSGGGVRRALVGEDATVVGIATGEAAIGKDGSVSVPFAVAGIVTVKADASQAPIRPGDLLVSSPIAGHAMSSQAAAPGTILGKALDGLESGTGVVRILVVLR